MKKKTISHWKDWKEKSILHEQNGIIEKNCLAPSAQTNHRLIKIRQNLPLVIASYMRYENIYLTEIYILQHNFPLWLSKSCCLWEFDLSGRVTQSPQEKEERMTYLNYQWELWLHSLTSVCGLDHWWHPLTLHRTAGSVSLERQQKIMQQENMKI